MKTTISLSTLVVLLFFNCKAQQFTIDKLPEKQLIFGSGGGMSGVSDTYILLENGQLFHTNSLAYETNELKRVSQAKAKEYFKKMADITFSEIQFDHPGNRYYFLEDRTAGTQNRIVWGSTEMEVPIECKTLYQELVAHLK